MMPKLDGFGLLKAIRNDALLASTPVIMLSARAAEEARIEGIEAGADDYLVKPFAADAGVELVGAQFGAFFYNVQDDDGDRYMLHREMTG